MDRAPDETRRDPKWLWPLVGLVALIVLGIIALVGARRPEAITPLVTAPGTPSSSNGYVVWVGTLATLMLYSLLYRENPYFRFAEHAFLGLGAAYGMYVIWGTNVFQNWYTPLFVEGKWGWTLALVAGLMYFTVYNRRLSWMSRLVMILIIALDAGSYVRVWAGDWVAQIGDSFRPLFTRSAPYVDFNNIIFVSTLLAVMVYFLFSFEQRSRAVRGTATWGRWLMMIAFGTMFGSTVMARMSLFIGRLTYLFQDWIHLIPRTPPQ